MPITDQERIEHMEKFGLNNLDTMHTADYRQILKEEAFFWTIRMVLSCTLFPAKELPPIRSS